MKYEINGKTVNIPDEVIAKSMQSLIITKDEAIELYLFDNDLLGNEEAEAMTAKAKASGNITRNQGVKAKRKAPERKPDELKRRLIKMLAGHLENEMGVEDGWIENAEVTNIERMITFTVGDEKFELTLTKKRKPKE